MCRLGSMEMLSMHDAFSFGKGKGLFPRRYVTGSW